MHKEQEREISTFREHWFTNKDGLQIYTHAWWPKGEPKGNLFIVHGLGEHSGRYAHMAKYFTERGLALFALDLQGHGLSEGKRGHVQKFKDFVQDVEQFRIDMLSRLANKPTFLFGHSMGGLIVFLYLLEYQHHVNAAILSAPAIGIKIDPPKWQKKLLSILVKTMPELRLNNAIDAAWLSHDLKIVEAYRNDPFVHPKISISLFHGMDKAGVMCLTEANKINIPVLFILGGDDKIVDDQAAHTAFTKISSADKKEIVFQNDFHEVHNEFDKMEEFKKIWEWLEPKL